MFGTVVAAGLPILVAVSGLAVSSTLTGVVIAFVDAPDWSTSLATMMGIGIGIDYALLMVTRFREWRAAGLDPERATVATLDTAGRAVMVAGTTVVVSMLGLFAMGLSFMRGAAVVTIVAVLVVHGRRRHPVPGPAGLPRPARRPAARPARPAAYRPPSRPAATSRPARTLAGLEPVRGAAPGRGRRGRRRACCWVWPRPSSACGSASRTPATTRPATSTRQAYDAVSRGFGPGANGPLLLAAELPAGAGAASLDPLRAGAPVHPRRRRGHAGDGQPGRRRPPS